MNTTPSIAWLKNRWVILGAIALLSLLLLTVLAAPSTPQASGSSFSRSPDGYGAWYAYLQQQGIAVERWERPYKDLDAELQKRGLPEGSVTLVQVTTDPLAPIFDAEKWLQQGNRLIILGFREPVTPANFRSTQPSPGGAVTVDTRRRRKLRQGEQQQLGDSFGAVVWQTSLHQGEVISTTTPFLAANAYQDEPGNFKFLADLATAEGNTTVWIDEYLHGYKEADVIVEEIGQTWGAYLANTPLLPVLFQAIALVVVLIWAGNQRFGLPLRLTTPKINNSRAYIEALAGVLQKAESSEFIVEVIGKEEQLRVQHALGLGNTLLDPDQLVNAWTAQTGRPANELNQALQPYWQKRRLSETDLKIWIGKLQTLRHQLPT
ncbi:DUF4350 domain-containing protein [Oscillatoria sp. FACHB-1407]|uniref:DUF4350 domain-containing protein n=1 Tax=Oscillatoria sp. FACHB-1407 TaxID=2692847 RepID=UPI00168417CE|nr:DUF4350 domain-containing protein [Oscillatoria sp. FACHB-1407]MBD2464072.1 DUF4350 domain-containing protein [Oscillatoria sp. FACHB-1407]